MGKIKRVELAVHLFDAINRRPFNEEYGYTLETEYTEDYGPEQEALMKNNYKRQIKDIASDRGMLIVLPHERVLREVHSNVMEIIHYALSLFPLEDEVDRFCYNETGSISPEGIDKIKRNLDKDLQVYAWGEFTTGCVLDELLRFYHALGIPIDSEKVKDSLVPEISIDFEGLYPRPWETLSQKETERRIDLYEKKVAERIANFEL